MTTWSLLFTWNFLLGVSTLADVKWMVMPTFLVPRRSKARSPGESVHSSQVLSSLPITSSRTLLLRRAVQIFLWRFPSVWEKLEYGWGQGYLLK